MISLDSLDMELMAEKMLADAYALRDEPNLDTFFQVMESLLRVGRHIQDQEGALRWAERQLLP